MCAVVVPAPRCSWTVRTQISGSLKRQRRNTTRGAVLGTDHFRHPAEPPRPFTGCKHPADEQRFALLPRGFLVRAADPTKPEARAKEHQVPALISRVVSNAHAGCEHPGYT